jgi:hypothetical protein
MQILCPGNGLISQVATVTAVLSCSEDKLLGRETLHFITRFSLEHRSASGRNTVRGNAAVKGAILPAVSSAAVDRVWERLSAFIASWFEAADTGRPLFGMAFELLSALPDVFGCHVVVKEGDNSTLVALRVVRTLPRLKALLMHRDAFSSNVNGTSLVELIFPPS